MATSSLACDAYVHTFVDDNANAPSEVNANFALIRNAFNASLETASGHDHDGTNSKSSSSAVGDMSILDISMLRLAGWEPI